MIQLPEQIIKGQSLSFYLLKELVSVPSGVTPKSVLVSYRSVVGNQRKRLIFNWDHQIPMASATWSLRARDSWLIERIALVDGDGGEISLSVPNGLNLSFAASVEQLFAFDGGLDGAGFSSVLNPSLGGAFTSI